MHSLKFEYKHGFLTKRDYENTDVNVITERVKTAKPLYAVRGEQHDVLIESIDFNHQNSSALIQCSRACAFRF